MINKAVFIKWHDAQSVDDWTCPTEVVPKLAEVHTLGLILSEDDKMLTLALNRDMTNDNYSCFIHVPKSCIFFRKNVPLKYFK